MTGYLHNLVEVLSMVGYVIPALLAVGAIAVLMWLINDVINWFDGRNMTYTAGTFTLQLIFGPVALLLLIPLCMEVYKQ